MLLKHAVVCCLRLWLCCWGNRLDNNIRNLRHVTDPCVTQYLCFQLAFSAQAQSPMPRNAAPSNCNTQAHNRINHIYSTYTIHSCSIMAGGYCCVQTALLALSESNPSEKKKNSLGGDTINDPGSRDFPACTAIFGIRFPEREPRLVFTWMREITWMLLLTGKGFVSNTIQVKSNSKFTNTF